MRSVQVIIITYAMYLNCLGVLSMETSTFVVLGQSHISYIVPVTLVLHSTSFHHLKLSYRLHNHGKGDTIIW